jgi:hypothetical protein
MSAILELIKHADVQYFAFPPDTLAEFFSSDFLSLIDTVEVQNFSASYDAWIVLMRNCTNFSAMKEFVKDQTVKTLAWGFEKVGWIKIIGRSTFEWNNGFSFNTKAADIVQAKKNSVITKSRMGRVQLGVKKVLSKGTKHVTEKFPIINNLVSSVKDLVENGDFVRNCVTTVRDGVGAVGVMMAVSAGAPAVVSVAPTMSTAITVGAPAVRLVIRHPMCRQVLRSIAVPIVRQIAGPVPASVAERLLR